MSYSSLEQVELGSSQTALSSDDPFKMQQTNSGILSPYEHVWYGISTQLQGDSTDALDFKNTGLETASMSLGHSLETL